MFFNKKALSRILRSLILVLVIIAVSISLLYSLGIEPFIGTTTLLGECYNQNPIPGFCIVDSHGSASACSNFDAEEYDKTHVTFNDAINPCADYAKTMDDKLEYKCCIPNSDPIKKVTLSLDGHSDIKFLGGREVELPDLSDVKIKIFIPAAYRKCSELSIIIDKVDSSEKIEGTCKYNGSESIIIPNGDCNGDLKSFPLVFTEDSYKIKITGYETSFKGSRFVKELWPIIKKQP
jgi:hypothetical protein